MEIYYLNNKNNRYVLEKLLLGLGFPSPAKGKSIQAAVWDKLEWFPCTSGPRFLFCTNILLHMQAIKSLELSVLKTIIVRTPDCDRNLYEETH